MNPWVKLFFLPIMILAGIIVSLSCALIISPIALCHRIRQMGRTRQDLIDFHARRDALVREREEAVAALGLTSRAKSPHA